MKKCKIGGQAVIEGVMMRGVTSAALAVRDEKKRIRIKTWRLKPKSVWHKIPIIRGVLSFISSMSEGTKTIMDSANVFGEEEQPSKFEKWMAEKLHIDIIKVVIAFSVIVGIALAVGLFIVLPSVVSRLICNLAKISETSGGRIWIEAGIKLLILFLYIWLTSFVKDIKRVYMYHGAEHKTINCFERDLELTVENAKSCKKFHNRCGTTFLFFVVLVGVLVFALLKVLLPENISGNEVYRVLIKLACLPITAGIAYELLMVIASSNFFLFYPFRLPGMLLQKITTKEPSEDMLEVALESFKAVLQLDENPEMPTYDRLTYKYVVDATRQAKAILDKAKITYDADIDWIIARVLKKNRSEINSYDEITLSQYDQIVELAKKRGEGKPLAYIFGDMSFYGRDFICDNRALIPRPETEELVDNTLKLINDNDSVLDLCCGSGCIGLTISLEKNVSVTLSDVSKNAVELTKENAKKYNLSDKVNVLLSDMFNSVEVKFDCIISNPPYIPTEDIKTLQKEVKDFEPINALDGGQDGLDFYRVIATNAKNYLNKDGILALEVGINQAQQVKDLLNDFDVSIIKDISNIDRIVIGRLKNV